MLDAGTGEHSLRWLCSLESKRITAVTGDRHRCNALRWKFSEGLRPLDRVITGNWLNHGLCRDEVFDVVVADYLLGAIDGFAPWFQDQLFGRLNRHVGRDLYIVGLEPFASAPVGVGAKLILQINRLRDACILLAGHRCYREYPRRWVERNLELHNYRIEQSKSFPIRFGESYINGQLEVCTKKLSFISNTTLSSGLRKQIDSLRHTSLQHISSNGEILFGEDYVIHATTNP